MLDVSIVRSTYLLIHSVCEVAGGAADWRDGSVAWKRVLLHGGNVRSRPIVVCKCVCVCVCRGCLRS